jgi:hypothetical protein
MDKVFLVEIYFVSVVKIQKSMLSRPLGFLLGRFAFVNNFALLSYILQPSFFDLYFGCFKYNVIWRGFALVCIFGF